MQKNLNKTLITTLAVGAALLLPTAAMAKVTGQCGNCHTMHNSQDGVSVTASGNTMGVLLNTGCIGCHTGTNSGTTTVPYVLDGTGAPVTTSLAGGNFYWVANGTDNTGHNVLGVATGDLALGDTPPGNLGVALGSQLTCGGTMGCHGQNVADEFGAIAGGHHGSGGSILAADTTKHFTAGSTTDMSDAYRMLSGVIGIEDDDWEFTTATAADHNQYYGVARTSETGTALGSVSNLCAKCHGSFHAGSGNVSTSFSSPWVRHPTDFDMATASGTEYAFYNGGDGTNPAPYSTEAPVAATIVAAGTATAAPLATVNVTSATANASAIVTCLSCHRAHGSANADLLRWDYSLISAATGGPNNNTGCFICHTTKDDL